MQISEDKLEQLCLDWFRAHGYTYAYGQFLGHNTRFVARVDTFEFKGPWCICRRETRAERSEEFSVKVGCFSEKKTSLNGRNYFKLKVYSSRLNHWG